jgi:hypothetical protein
MWIFKAKSDTAGDVSRFKARFVAKGCSQRAGLDYTKTFSLVIRMASLRLFLTIAAARDLELCQLDIDTTFLYAPIREDVTQHDVVRYFRRELSQNFQTHVQKLVSEVACYMNGRMAFDFPHAHKIFRKLIPFPAVPNRESLHERI